MITNLVDYFLAEQEFYLDRVYYSRIDRQEKEKEYLLNCIDNIDVSVADDTVRIIVKRNLKFEPGDIFELEVSFGAVLRFDEERKVEYDWNNVNMEEEFRENGHFVIGNLMTRMSLLIAQITSSYGQPPIVLPPGIASKNN